MASSVLEYIRTTAEADPKTALDLALAENERLAAEAKATAEVTFGPDGLQAVNLSGVWRMARAFVQAGLTPEGSKGKSHEERIAELVVAIAYGREIGLTPLAAVQNVMVVNGRPTIYGDAAKALVLQSPVCEYVREWSEGTGDDYAWICEAKRKGQVAERTKFSVADAKKARLWGKNGPWTFYPARMLMFRARGFRLRDSFPDVLKGLILFEEHEAAMPIDPASANHEVGTRTERLVAKLGGEPAVSPEPPPVEAQDGSAPQAEKPAEPEAEPPADDGEALPADEAEVDAQQQAAEQAGLVAEYEGKIEDSRTEGELSAWVAHALGNEALTARSTETIWDFIAKRRAVIARKPAALPPRRGRPPKNSEMFPA